MAPTFLFVGPTLSRAQKIDPGLSLNGLEVRGPIKRGQLPRIIKTERPGALVIIDGLFHTEVAVGHAEIRMALARGWTVWGLSSMGAIRAREMATLGMRGYGDVYDLFCQEGVDFRDDEVTLMHDTAPDYTELSEPLVHMRAATRALVSEGVIPDTQRDVVLHELEGMWYADRTLEWLGARLRQVAPDHVDRLRCIFNDFDRFRIKSLDLIRFLSSGLLGR